MNVSPPLSTLIGVVVVVDGPVSRNHRPAAFDVVPNRQWLRCSPVTRRACRLGAVDHHQRRQQKCACRNPQHAAADGREKPSFHFHSPSRGLPPSGRAGAIATGLLRSKEASTANCESLNAKVEGRASSDLDGRDRVSAQNELMPFHPTLVQSCDTVRALTPDPNPPSRHSRPRPRRDRSRARHRP